MKTQTVNQILLENNDALDEALKEDIFAIYNRDMDELPEWEIQMLAQRLLADTESRYRALSESLLEGTGYWS